MGKSKSYFSIFLASVIFLTAILQPFEVSAASKSIPIVVLNKYSMTMAIGDENTLIAVSSTGALPRFKSSSSKVASVNTYGRITAKSSGTVKVTAKIKNAEASCKITVLKTSVALNQTSIALENGARYQLKAQSSNGAKISFRSSRSSIAAVDENGLITAKKPGEAVITAKANQTTVTCKVAVRRPSVKLSQTRASLYRGQKFTLAAKISSKSKPIYKTSRKSIATVNENGVVTAIRHGAAVITVSVDGVSKTCEVTVKSPKIQLKQEEISMKVGEKKRVEVDVSSGNKPRFSSNKCCVAPVDENGVVTAYKKGNAVITVSEDGARVYCRITVTE